MTWLGIIALILASGICYRIRGSEFYANGFGSRALKLAIGAAPRGLGVWLFAPWWIALIAWVLCAAADSDDGAPAGMGFGGPGDDSFVQARTLAAAGFISMAFVILLLAVAWWIAPPVPWQVFPLALIGGLAEPLAYWLGWHTPSLGKAGDPWWRRLLKGTEWGELYTGLLLGLFTLAAV